MYSIRCNCLELILEQSPDFLHSRLSQLSISHTWFSCSPEFGSAACPLGCSVMNMHIDRTISGVLVRALLYFRGSAGAVLSRIFILLFILLHLESTLTNTFLITLRIIFVWCLIHVLIWLSCCCPA